MPELDELKEKLQSIRTGLIVIFATIIALTGGIIVRYDSKGLDFLVILGGIVDAGLFVSIPVLVRWLGVITKKVGQL